MLLALASGFVVFVFAYVDRKVTKAALAKALDQSQERIAAHKAEALGANYREAGEPGPSSPVGDGALPIQSLCPKCKKSTGRAFFAVVYREETDRLHVMCGEFTHEGKVICGCGAKWVELPGKVICGCGAKWVELPGDQR